MLHLQSLLMELGPQTPMMMDKVSSRVTKRKTKMKSRVGTAVGRAPKRWRQRQRRSSRPGHDASHPPRYISGRQTNEKKLRGKLPIVLPCLYLYRRVQPITAIRGAVLIGPELYNHDTRAAGVCEKRYTGISAQDLIYHCSRG